jgi:hypothetical protein
MKDEVAMRMRLRLPSAPTRSAASRGSNFCLMVKVTSAFFELETIGQATIGRVMFRLRIFAIVRKARFRLASIRLPEITQQPSIISSRWSWCAHQARLPSSW